MSDQIGKARRRQKLRHMMRSKGLMVGLVAVAFVALLAFAGIRKAFPQGVSIEKLQSQQGLDHEREKGQDDPGVEDGRSSDEGPAVTREIVVDIDGAVEKPGVVKLAAGSKPVRLDDAIQAAGGLSSQADTARINRAALVADGAKIHIPAKGEVQSPAEGTASGDAQQSSGMAGSQGGQQGGEGKININTASETQLQELPGIGPSLSRSILEYRKKKPFKAIGDLQKVPGIGAKKYEKLKDGICV